MFSYGHKSAVRTSAAAAFLLANVSVSEAKQLRYIGPLPDGKSIVQGDVTHPIAAYGDFCRRYNEECNYTTNQPAMLTLTRELWGKLNRVNRAINRQIIQQPDRDHHQVEDRWDLAEDDIGDCEDITLRKRKALVEAGLPRSSLPIAVVNDPKGEGHAILLVRTNRGDLSLDNINRSIVPIDQTGYTPIKVIDPADFSRFRTIVALEDSPRAQMIAAGRLKTPTLLADAEPPSLTPGSSNFR